MFIAVILGNCLAVVFALGGIAELWFRFSAGRPDSAESFMHDVLASALYFVVSAVLLLLVQIATFLEKLYIERKEGIVGVKSEKSAPATPFKKKEQKPASASGEYFRADPMPEPAPEPVPVPKQEAAPAVVEAAAPTEKKEEEKTEEKEPVKTEPSLNFFRID
ncbi:MAG: hypothetical protein IKT79_11765 [Akkermansia sp.]|nr:hypothetical protein [Akkermansia sp.]